MKTLRPADVNREPRTTSSAEAFCRHAAAFSIGFHLKVGEQGRGRSGGKKHSVKNAFYFFL